MTTIEADGVTLSIVDNVHGPAVRATGDADAFGFILNGAMRGLIPNLEECLERGEETACGDLFVSRPDPGDDLGQLVEKWRRISDRDPGDDLYLIGVAGLANLVVVPRLTLLSLFRQLKALSRTWMPALESAARAPVPQPDASARFTPDDELPKIEERAREVDLLAERAASEDERATTAAKRRILLSDLHHANVLDGGKVGVLVERGLPTLASYADAAGKLCVYLASAQRGKYLPPVEVTRLDRMPVSLDWFRFPNRVPAGFDADEWLAHCELGLRMAAPLEGGEGEFFTGGDGRPTATVYWRKDDGATPAIVRARFR